jgi:5-methylcytosine-specific restriction endonuclease McrA
MDNSAGINKCSNCSRPLQATYLAKPGWSVCKACDTPALKKERLRVLTHLRRAYSAGLPATLSLAEWLHTLQDFNGLCAYCQQRQFEALEHFIPIDAGGGTTVQNCVPACGRCNTTKGTSNPDSQQLDLFINENRERVRRYLAGRTQSPSINVDFLADFDDLQGTDFSP